MAVLSVPAPYRAALQELAALSDDRVQQIADAFAEAHLFQTVEQLKAVVADALAPEEEDLANWLVPALLSLAGQLRGDPVDAIASQLSGSADLDLTSDMRARLRDRLEAILRSDALVTTAVAVELLTQHDRNYQTARVLTDRDDRRMARRAGHRAIRTG